MNKYHAKPIRTRTGPKTDPGFGSSLTKQEASREANRMTRTAGKAGTTRIEDSTKDEMIRNASRIRTAGNKRGRK